MIRKVIWAVIGLVSLFIVVNVVIFAVITFGFYTWSVVGVAIALTMIVAAFWPLIKQGGREHHA